MHTCPKCGVPLLEDLQKCAYCDVQAVEPDEVPEEVVVGADDGELYWRREVARRLDEYRARRARLQPDTELPLFPGPDREEELRERPRTRPASRPRQSERVEICIQPELDFSSTPGDRARPQTALVPVASLAERRMAGTLDSIFLLLACAGFLGLFLPLFRSLGGQIVLGKVDAIVYFTAFFLFYAQYFFIFTTFAGATPGMQLRGLTIVRLDGTLPDTRQLLWRSFGYILSGAALFLGFLWAIWDEDHFTWQDRISQTYVTAAAPIDAEESLEIHPARHGFAHK